MSVAAEYQQESIEMERRNQMTFEDWKSELLNEINLMDELELDEHEVLRQFVNLYVANKNDHAFFGIQSARVLNELIDKKVNEAMEEFNNEYSAFSSGY